jgi:hypothetical protein
MGCWDRGKCKYSHANHQCTTSTTAVNRFQVAYSAVGRCLGGSRGHGGQQLGAAAQGPVRGRPLHALRGAGGWRRLVRSALACAEGPGG